MKFLSEAEVLKAINDGDLERHTIIAKTANIPPATLADAVNEDQIAVTIDANGTKRSRKSDVVKWLMSRGTPRLKGAAAARAQGGAAA
jgi:hypothetical protein